MSDSPIAMPIAGVLFDFGGVVLSSPFEAFTAYEEKAGLPHGFLRRLNTNAPDANAWACMERGEIDEPEFYRRFETEALRAGGTIDARALMASLSGRLDAGMVAAIRALRGRYRVACLTNNMRVGKGPAMAASDARAAEIADVMTLFERVIESSHLGSRKPETRFYEKACELLSLDPAACVYLDDLGINLKPARALGMRTIKVTSSAQALAELETLLGHPIHA